MIEGLKLALKHCTKYEDKMFLQFLIKVEERRIQKLNFMSDPVFVETFTVMNKLLSQGNKYDS